MFGIFKLPKHPAALLTSTYVLQCSGAFFIYTYTVLVFIVVATFGPVITQRYRKLWQVAMHHQGLQCYSWPKRSAPEQRLLTWPFSGGKKSVLTAVSDTRAAFPLASGSLSERRRGSRSLNEVAVNPLVSENKVALSLLVRTPAAAAHLVDVSRQRRRKGNEDMILKPPVAQTEWTFRNTAVSLPCW